MSMDPRWNDIDRGKPKISEKHLSQCHCVHHKSHMDWPRYEPGHSHTSVLDPVNFCSLLYDTQSEQLRRWVFYSIFLTLFIFLKRFSFLLCYFVIFKYKALVGNPDEKRPLGSPRRRYDNIKMDIR
jgi:hypothetical protein